MNRNLSRRSMLAGTGALSAQLLFHRRLGAAILGGAAQQALAAAPGVVDLTLTAMTPNTLRIAIAPIPSEAPAHELGVIEGPWPAPLEPPGPARTHDLSWGKYTIHIDESPLRITVREGSQTRQQIWLDTDTTELHFALDGPVFGAGDGAHPFDRRGTREAAVNGQVAPDYRTFGARVQFPWVISPTGWGLFVGQSLGSFEFTQQEGSFRAAEACSIRNIFLLLGEGPAQVLEEYAHLTGFPHMPPRWALGYMQSHRTLASHDEVLGVVKTFRERKLPCDAVIYLGTGFCPSGWNTGHGSFTFNEQVFPDPPAMLKEIHDAHFKVVLHDVSPGDLHGSVNDTGHEAEEPGDAVPYWQPHAALEQLGADGWWPDDGDKFSVYVRFARNRLYYEGSRKTQPDRRPFALHRNGYAGMQRFAWLWTGDTACRWQTLRGQIMVGLNAALSGITYWGTDIGGFVPTAELTPELYVRWFQWAAFCPLFRGHGRAWKLRLPWGWNMGDPGPKEVEGDWVASWPPAADLHRADVESICRKYLNLRYQLLPYLYSTVAKGHATGLPLIRPLSLGWPGDSKAVLTEDAYLFGDHILVAPVYEKDATVRGVYLPGGSWWDFWTNEQKEGGTTIQRAVDLDTIPLYVRAGAIVPIGPVRQYTSEPSTDPLTLRIYPGADGRFTWYDDDGISYRYESGEFLRVDCAWNDSTRTLTLTPDPSGHMPLPPNIRLEVVGTGQSKLVELPRKGVSLKL